MAATDKPGAGGGSGWNKVPGSYVGVNPNFGRHSPAGASVDEISPATTVGGGPGEVQQAINIGYQINDDTTRWRYRQAVQLFVRWPDGSQGGCSGTLIGWKTVLTAGHCIYKSSKGGYALSVRAVPGLDRDYMPYGDAWVSPFGGYYVSSEWHANENDDYDWGFIILDRNIGVATGGYLGLAYASDNELSDAWVDIVGYPGETGVGPNKSSTSIGQVTCTDATMVYTSAISSSGLSGAGMLPWLGPWADHVVAINTGGDFNLLCGTLQTQERATRITSGRYNEIMQYLDNPALPTDPPDYTGWWYRGGQSNAQISMISAVSDQHDAFVRGMNNTVYHQQRSGGAWLPSAYTWQPLGGQMVGRVAAVSRTTNQIDLFYRERPFGIDVPTRVCTKARNYTTWWPSGQQWYCFNDFLTLQQPAAISTSPSALHVFGVGAAGTGATTFQVGYKRWSGLGGWEPVVNLGGNSHHPVAAVSRASYWWDIFIRDAVSGQICTKSKFADYWPSETGWFCLAGSKIDGAPTVVSSGPNSLDVFGVLQNDNGPEGQGQVVRMWWRGGAWQGPMPLGGNLTGIVSAVSKASGQIDLFARAANGDIVTKSLDGVIWAPSQTGWTDLEGDMVDVAAVATGPNRLDVLARNRSDLSVRYRYWDGQWRP